MHLTVNQEMKVRFFLPPLWKKLENVLSMAIQYKSGKCCICGYNRYIGALEFHHLGPNQKDFGIGSKGYTRSFDKVKKELDKCICVCANCHREIHAGLIDITNHIGGYFNGKILVSKTR